MFGREEDTYMISCDTYQAAAGGRLGQYLIKPVPLQL